MNFKTRYSGFSNARTSETVKNWVIGWTLDEARAAAQRARTVEKSAVKPAMFGVLVSGAGSGQPGTSGYFG